MRTSEKKEKSAQFYKVYPDLIREIGRDAADLIAALTAKQIYMYHFGKQDPAGYFYYEHPQLEEDLDMTTYKQKVAMEKLVELKLLDISREKKGTPPKTFYKVDIPKYEKLVLDLSDKYRIQKKESQKQKKMRQTFGGKKFVS